MTRAILTLLALSLAGCATAPPGEEKTGHAWVWIAGIAAGAAIAVAVSDDDKADDKPCKTTIGGSGADFDFSCR